MALLNDGNGSILLPNEGFTHSRHWIVGFTLISIISLDEAKRLVAKFYLGGELTNEECIALNDFTKRYTYPDLYEGMRKDSKYEKLMPTIEVKKKC